MSLLRQNYSADCEAGVNRQINLELYAMYVYLAMASHFDRDDVALPGFSTFFRRQSHEERSHADKLLKFQNVRGGRVVLEAIEKPPTVWNNGLAAMEAALELELKVNKRLLHLHDLASKHGDKQMCDFLETEFLSHQVEEIRQFAGYIANLKLVGPGLGEYQFDVETLRKLNANDSD